MDKTAATETQERTGFFVFIIESPSAPDFYHKRFEGELLCKALSLAGINSEHRLTVNREAFCASFAYGLAESIKQYNAFPILHISSHGYKDGIQLTSGDVINWEELRNLIQPINTSLNGTLVVTLSTCEGYAGCQMAMHEGELPFLAMIGPVNHPKWSETAIAFLTFYHQLASGRSFEVAINAMKIASGNDGFALSVGPEMQKSFIEEIKKVRMQVLIEALEKESSSMQNPEKQEGF